MSSKLILVRSCLAGPGPRIFLGVSTHDGNSAGEDIWSFGIMLYSMLTGYSHFNTQLGEDVLLDAKSADEILQWKGLTDNIALRFQKKRAKITTVTKLTPAQLAQDQDLCFWARECLFVTMQRSSIILCPSTKVDTVSSFAVDLISWCTRPSPEHRPETMKVVLEHKFFKGNVGRLEDGGKPYFFMSHAQASGGAQTRLLTRLLENACPHMLLDKVWLDGELLWKQKPCICVIDPL